MKFVKGDPRINRNGAPRGRNRKIISTIALAELAKTITVGNEKHTGAQWIMKSGIRRAIKGDHNWAKFVFGYAYGLPKQQVELTGEDGGPIRAGLSEEDFERGLNELGFVRKEQ